jgi:large subunit ribosomal protein L13
MKTYVAKKGELKPEWFVVDATDQVLGRLAARVATILMGKHKPTYTPHIDTGDFVVVVNAEKVRMTGKKLDQRVHKSYSGYPGGLKEQSLRRVRDTHPQRIVSEAVRRMMPKNKLSRAMMKKLKVHVGPNHPHQAQNCQTLEL